MRNSIDVVPVWDAANKQSHCLLCTLQHRLEDVYLEHYMGDSKMESDTRERTNLLGFCQQHFQRMLQSKEGKLGLALLTHTHLLQQIQTFEAEEKRMHALLSGKKTALLRIGKLAERYRNQAEKQTCSCNICNDVQTHMHVYYHTFCHLMEHDSEFVTLFESGNGLCLHHYASVRSELCRGIQTKTKTQAYAALCAVQRRNLQKDAADLDWFTQKFDYRNNSQPWGDAKDALPRAINRLEGIPYRDASLDE